MFLNGPAENNTLHANLFFIHIHHFVTAKRPISWRSYFRTRLSVIYYTSSIKKVIINNRQIFERVHKERIERAPRWLMIICYLRYAFMRAIDMKKKLVSVWELYLKKNYNIWKKNDTLIKRILIIATTTKRGLYATGVDEMPLSCIGLPHGVLKLLYNI